MSDHGLPPVTPVPLTEQEPRKRVHQVVQTVTQRYFFDPEEIKRDFYDAWEAFEYRGGSFEDFVIDLFEQHDGSQFCDSYFGNDANPSVGVEIVERWDDE